MADELDSFITALTTALKTITGLLDAPEHPPEGLAEFPVVVCYFVRGRPTMGAGFGCTVNHTVHADIHLSRSMLPEDEKEARPFILRGLALFAANVTMSGTCEHCIPTEYIYGRLLYGTQETFGVRWILDVKIRHSGITVAA